jgi:hypothetical protein
MIVAIVSQRQTNYPKLFPHLTQYHNKTAEYSILPNFFLATCSTYGGKREVHAGFWWGDLREGQHLGDPGVDGRIILKRIFKKWDGAWTGLSCLRIGTGGGLL